MKKILLFLAVLMVVLFVSAAPLWAFDSKSGDKVSISKNLDDDLYIVGSDIVISKDIDGDLITAGGQIEVTGSISQDIMAAAGTLNIGGVIGDDARIAGGMLTISAKITDDLVATGGQITVLNDADIGGTAVISGGTIKFNGNAGEGAIFNASDITISGRINGNVEIGDVGSLKITDSAEITGDLTYSSSSRATISDDAVIGGEVKETITQKQKEVRAPRTSPWTVFTATFIGGKVIAFLALFVLGLILILVMPGFFERFTTRMKKTLGYCVGAGAVVIFGVPIGSMIIFIISIILFITIIGSGIGGVALLLNIIMLIVYGLIIYTSTIFLSYTLGKVILSKTKLNLEKYGWKVLAYLIGLVIIMLLYSIPFAGWLIRFAGVLFGSGAIMLALKDIIWSKKK